MTTKELIVLNELKKHKEQWMTGMNIMSQIFNVTMGNCDLSAIEVRAIVQHLRLMGNTIIAGTKGYKLTDSIKEIKEYCSYRRTEIELELKVLSAIEQKAQELTNKVGK